MYEGISSSEMRSFIINKIVNMAFLKIILAILLLLFVSFPIAYFTTGIWSIIALAVGFSCVLLLSMSPCIYFILVNYACKKYGV